MKLLVLFLGNLKNRLLYILQNKVNFDKTQCMFQVLFACCADENDEACRSIMFEESTLCINVLG